MAEKKMEIDIFLSPIFFPFFDFFVKQETPVFHLQLGDKSHYGDYSFRTRCG
jgi:hypothetical protein